jgi:phosphoglycolate phosphatase-like HAD superfamily hydrolase
MSGGVMLSALLREAGRTLSEEEVRHFQVIHRAVYARQALSLGVLPGTHDLLATWTGRPHSVCHRDERPHGEHSPHAELDRTYADAMKIL